MLTLRTIGSLSGVTAQGSKRVYIVENPAVFSVLVNEWPEETLLCGNGQNRLATLVLLDLFDTDTIFWYAGDFDPEGLQIAQRLKQRYQDRLHLWNYQSRYYEASRSQVAISDQSLKNWTELTSRSCRRSKRLCCGRKARPIRKRCWMCT